MDPTESSMSVSIAYMGTARTLSRAAAHVEPAESSAADAVMPLIMARRFVEKLESNARRLPIDCVASRESYLTHLLMQ